MKNKNILKSFNSLRGTSAKKQIDSSLDILHHFSIKQTECKEEDCCEELKLGIGRVIRGLGAPRTNSRKGFYLAFVGVCELFSSPTISVQMCFDAIEKELQEFSSNTEKTDVYKGQILAYGGIIYSGKILEASDKEIKKVLKCIISVGKQKSYLMLASYVFLIELINKADDALFEKAIWDTIRDKLILTDKVTKSLQWYNILFLLNKKFPNIVDEHFLLNAIGCQSVLHKDNLDLFGKSLLAVTQNATHIDSPTYTELLTELANNKKVLKKLWLIVDDRLSSISSVIMIHIFKIFIHCIQLMKDKNFVLRMLTPNFVKLFQTKSEDVEVEEIRCNAIEKLSKVLFGKCVLTSKSQEELVQKLYFYPGSFSFLRGAGMKIFYSLVNDFNEATVKSVSILFQCVLADHDKRTSGQQSNNELVMTTWKESHKKDACNILIRLMNHSKVSLCTDWKVEQMKLFIDLAFFTKNASEKFSKFVRGCFYSALDVKYVSLTDLRKFLHDSVTYFDFKLQNDENCTIEFTKDMKKSWKKMINTVNLIMNDSSDNTDNKKLTTTVFQIMFLLFGVTMFKERDSTIQNLKELHVIYKKMQTESKEVSKSTDDEKELHWTDVIVDLILSLLSNSYHFHRSVISKVFGVLCPFLSTQNIHQILNILNPNTENVMTADADQSMEIDNEDNVKDTSLKKKSEKESGSDSDSDEDDETTEESSEESDLEEDMDEDTDYDKLRATIREALGDAGAVTDTESVDLNDLDEEEGKRLDKSLAQAFSQMKQQKSKTSDKQLSDFRIRVIDLLMVWLKNSPDLNLVFDGMVTALLLLESILSTGTDQELQIKLRSFLKELSLLNDFTNNEKLDVKQLVALMKKLLGKDDKTKSVYISMCPQIISCCKFILKISLKDLKGIYKMRPLVLDVYKDALHKFFNEKHSIVPVGLFQTALDCSWDGSFSLVEDMLSYTLKPDVGSFYLQHAFNLLHRFLKNKRILNEDNCKKYNNEIRQITSKWLQFGVDVLKTKPYKFHNQFIEICKSLKKIHCVSDIIDKFDIESLKKKSNEKRKLDDNETMTNVKKQKKIDKLNANEDTNGTSTTTKKSKLKKGKADKKTDKRKSYLKLKKQRNLERTEKLSQGFKEGVFGSHLIDE